MGRRPKCWHTARSSAANSASGTDLGRLGHRWHVDASADPLAHTPTASGRVTLARASVRHCAAHARSAWGKQGRSAGAGGRSAGAPVPNDAVLGTPPDHRPATNTSAMAATNTATLPRPIMERGVADRHNRDTRHDRLTPASPRRPALRTDSSNNGERGHDGACKALRGGSGRRH